MSTSRKPPAPWSWRQQSAVANQGPLRQELGLSRGSCRWRGFREAAALECLHRGGARLGPHPLIL